MSYNINFDHTSPNYWEGKYPFKAIVLHGTDSPGTTYNDLLGAIGWLCNPQSNASAHYIIHVDGTIYCLVNPYSNLVAWANGFLTSPDISVKWIADCLAAGENPNYYTISIEHMATGPEMIGRQSMPVAQAAASKWLVSKLCADFKLTPGHETILGHYQFDSVTRVNCPGVINIPEYITELQAMNFDPNPKKFSVGPGVLGEMTKRKEHAATNEQFFSPNPGQAPGLAQRSFTWSEEGHIYLAIQDVKPDGTPLPTWSVQVVEPI